MHTVLCKCTWIWLDLGFEPRLGKAEKMSKLLTKSFISLVIGVNLVYSVFPVVSAECKKRARMKWRQCSRDLLTDQEEREAQLSTSSSESMIFANCGIPCSPAKEATTRKRGCSVANKSNSSWYWTAALFSFGALKVEGLYRANSPLSIKACNNSMTSKAIGWRSFKNGHRIFTKAATFLAKIRGRIKSSTFHIIHSSTREQKILGS
mmetsp:Transcript_49569/g.97186  ORF Transcript_49569/g.97186 Transcript_49569/m.97186 type:complete len:207 (-) Transcript_49569:8175-8795(-)